MPSLGNPLLGKGSSHSAACQGLEIKGAHGDTFRVWRMSCPSAIRVSEVQWPGPSATASASASTLTPFLGGWALLCARRSFVAAVPPSVPLKPGGETAGRRGERRGVLAWLVG